MNEEVGVLGRGSQLAGHDNNRGQKVAGICLFFYFLNLPFVPSLGKKNVLRDKKQNGCFTYEVPTAVYKPLWALFHTWYSCSSYNITAAAR